jgi:hypothetical protein
MDLFEFQENADDIIMQMQELIDEMPQKGNKSTE